jgi:hypothetical protein
MRLPHADHVDDLWQKEPRGTNAHSSGAHSALKKVINRNDAAAICFCSGDESKPKLVGRIRKFLCIKRYNFYTLKKC